MSETDRSASALRCDRDSRGLYTNFRVAFSVDAKGKNLIVLCFVE